MSNLMRDVEITDNNGNTYSVTGVLTNDNKFVVASALQIWIGEEKLSSNGSGNKTKFLGFGTIHIFRADNVNSTNEDGIMTGELTKIQGPLPVRMNEITKPSGDVSISINSYLNDRVSSMNNAKSYSEVTNSEIRNAAYASLRIAAEEIDSKPSMSDLATASSIIAQKVVGKPINKKKIKQYTVSDTQEVSGVTADQVLSD